VSIAFKITSQLLRAVREDLRCPHRFAHERVGFVSCRAAALPDHGILVLAESYHPVADEDYIDDNSIGALIGSAGIRKALQVGLSNNAGMFHIHIHEHLGVPRFSGIDLKESAKFVPDFFNVAPNMLHGAIVLSKNAATGLCWLTKDQLPVSFDEISFIGAPLRMFWHRL
jgi:hypothetical protein